eukprot:SAG31_NODE_4517_length_3171_cov_4.097331_1_plen_94_part_00
MLGRGTISNDTIVILTVVERALPQGEILIMKVREHTNDWTKVAQAKNQNKLAAAQAWKRRREATSCKIPLVGLANAACLPAHPHYTLCTAVTA